MTERQRLERDIEALRNLLRLAWQDLSIKTYTTYERREMRNEMSHRAAELRQLLQLLDAELNRDRQESAARYSGLTARSVELRLLARDR